MAPNRGDIHSIPSYMNEAKRQVGKPAAGAIATTCDDQGPRYKQYTIARHSSGLRRKQFLSIFNDLIFDSRVDRGIPSFSAAPAGPNTRPPLASRASSIMFFSCF